MIFKKKDMFGFVYFQMQLIAQQENPQAELTPLNMYNKFVERIRRHLHVVLAFSPIGDAFRNRLRMFPSLINCCTIDWFKVGTYLTTIKIYTCTYSIFFTYTHGKYIEMGTFLLMKIAGFYISWYLVYVFSVGSLCYVVSLCCIWYVSCAATRYYKNKYILYA